MVVRVACDVTGRVGAVDQDAAVGVALEQVVDEAHDDDEAGRRRSERQAGETLDERGHQGRRQMPGHKIHRYCTSIKEAIVRLVSYEDDRKRSDRWKNRAVYFTWKMVGSNRLYSFS